MTFLLYNNASKGGQAMANAVGVGYEDTGKSRGYNCINWGSSTNRTVRFKPDAMLNSREAVDIAVNKLKTFERIRTSCVVPDYTTNIGLATEWLEDGFKVYCRTQLTANQGRGIVVVDDPDDLIYAQLYTKQVLGHREYRVHVFQGGVIGVSKKVKQDDCDVDDDIRNHDRGWRFSLCNVNRVHHNIKSEAIAAVSKIGLDFGAVDLIWNAEDERATILEVNTAPQCEGTIFDNYVASFKMWLAYEEEEEKTYDVSIRDMDAELYEEIIRVLNRSSHYDYRVE